MILLQLNNLDRETGEAIQKNNDQYARDRDEIGHEERYEAIMQRWRMETERILSLRKNPYESP